MSDTHPLTLLYDSQGEQSGNGQKDRTNQGVRAWGLASISLMVLLPCANVRAASSLPLVNEVDEVRAFEFFFASC